MKVNDKGYPSDKSIIIGTLNGWYTEQVTAKEVVFWGYLDQDALGRFPPNSWIHTSGVKLKGAPKEGDVIETRNNKYALGVPLRIMG
jgi:hypothetical protein